MANIREVMVQTSTNENVIPTAYVYYTNGNRREYKVFYLPQTVKDFIVTAKHCDEEVSDLGIVKVYTKSYYN